MNTLEIRHKNTIIVIHRPELPADERKKKEQRIEHALHQFGKAMQDAERKGKK